MTDKSDTRGLVERLPGLIADATPGPWIAHGEYIDATAADGAKAICKVQGYPATRPGNAALIALAPTLAVLVANDLPAALSCVRRLLDGWEPVRFADGWSWTSADAPIPLSPSEVHIIEMVRGEGG